MACCPLFLLLAKKFGIAAPKKKSNLQTCTDSNADTHEIRRNFSNSEEDKAYHYKTIDALVYDVQHLTLKQLVAKHEINRQSAIHIQSTIMVWCPYEKVSSDYVASLLNEFGEVESILNRWVPENRHNCQAAFEGMIVKYRTKDMAMKAVKGLPFCSKYIQSIHLTEVLKYFVESEIHHPELNLGGTHVIIRGKVPMSERDISDLKEFLYTIGTLTYLKIEKHMQGPGIICEAWFLYASQAYIATLILNESLFHLVPLRVTVKNKRKEKDILMDVKINMMEYVERYHLP